MVNAFVYCPKNIVTAFAFSFCLQQKLTSRLENVCKIEDERLVITVVEIGHRKEVYDT